MQQTDSVPDPRNQVKKTAEDDIRPSSYAPLMFGLLCVSAAAGVWLNVVSKRVQEPYLDEVFHVGQAQTYCEGRFQEWNPKITTPPGLYLLSTIVNKLSGACSLFALRALNSFIIAMLFLVICDTGAPAWVGVGESDGQKQAQPSKVLFKGHVAASLRLIIHQAHTAFNICLFPPLFFFSALYYTDVASTVSVLVFHRHFLSVYTQPRSSITQDILTVILGAATLFFRQTNIFWVSVFPVGMLLVSNLGLRPDPSRNSKHETSSHHFSHSPVGVSRAAWSDDILFDPPVKEARIDDYLLCVLSLVTRTTKGILTFPTKDGKPYRSIARMLLPHITLLALFVAFVAWNGGVVLGDKSNHVATLHLPQMLYMWAYISFFSMPLIYPYFLQGLLALLALLPVVTIMEPTLIFSRRSVLPRVYVAGAFTLISVLTVRFNTIVHPFTLADNRHYTFYVFRYLIRHPMIRFLVVPIYIICAWAVVQAYSCPAKLFFSEDPGSTYYVQSGKRKAVEDKESADTHRPIKLNRAAEGQGCDVSFVIVWLATSSLQLVTAPLVEPRYFIMPWIMWRMSVPLSCSADPEEREKKEKGLANRVWQLLWKDHDHRLWLETVWFLAINAVTGWIFLHWAFEWEQEPGKVQRFMW